MTSKRGKSGVRGDGACLICGLIWLKLLEAGTVLFSIIRTTHTYPHTHTRAHAHAYIHKPAQSYVQLCSAAASRVVI